MGHLIVQVDSFTEQPFAGNPAGVCILDAPGDPDWMQSVAREVNLSETAFLHPEGEGYRLRWFTPLLEVDLCGHATLASAHVLWSEGLLAPEKKASFVTRSGPLSAVREGGRIVMDFPSHPPEECTPPFGLIDALNVDAKFIGKNAMDVLVEVENEDAVRALRPDFRALTEATLRGVMVTAPPDDIRYDFVSRFFAPSVGINEDPVTGSAHCCLGPFWGERLDKTEMLGQQVSARGGVVGVELCGDRVRLKGHAVTVLRGELAV